MSDRRDLDLPHVTAPSMTSIVVGHLHTPKKIVDKHGETTELQRGIQRKRQIERRKYSERNKARDTKRNVYLHKEGEGTEQIRDEMR